VAAVNNRYHKHCFTRRYSLCRTRVHINVRCAAKVAISSKIGLSKPISGIALKCISFRYYLNSDLVTITDSLERHVN
jgi:hypothetical protein